MLKLETRQWQAKWLWQRENREVNGHLLFRKDFDLPATLPTPATPGNLPPATPAARLFIATESFATVYINGELAHLTTSLSYPQQHYYEEADVTRFLKPGRNRLAVVARYIGIPSGASCPKDPGLLCELVIGGTGPAAGTKGATSGPAAGVGATLVVASDSSWKVLRLEAWSGQTRRSEWFNLDLVEVMDYRKLPADWPMVEDLSAFEESWALRQPGVRFPQLEPRPFPKAVLTDYRDLKLVKAGTVRDRSGEFAIAALAVSNEEFAICDPAAVGLGADLGNFTVPPTAPGQAVAMMFDLGKYMAGYPALEASGCPGAMVDIAYHEKLQDGLIHTDYPGIYCADRYTLSGRVDRIMTDEWKGLRYLQLTFRNVERPLVVRNFRLVESAYPLRQKSFFNSSNPKLNRIFEISLNASRLCMQDNIMDCPWREKRQWIGDAQRIGLVNHYGFGDRLLLRGVLRQQVQLQHPTGRIWVCLPLCEEYPAQTMEWLRAVVEYDKYTGDETLVAELCDNIEMAHRWFMSCRDERGVFYNPHVPIINWMDNPYGRLIKYQHQTPFAGMNLRYLMFLEDVAACFRRLGRRSEARQALAERARIAALIPQVFGDGRTGLLRDLADPALPVTYSEMAHAQAVCAGIAVGGAAADGAAAPAAAAGVELWDRFKAYRAAHSDEIISPSPFGKYHTFEALGQLGRQQELLDEIMAGWGPMVDAGSDTAWEGFDGKASWCHGWAGTPVVALMRYIFKMDPRKPGKKKVKNVAGLEWATCEVRV